MGGLGSQGAGGRVAKRERSRGEKRGEKRVEAGQGALSCLGAER